MIIFVLNETNRMLIIIHEKNNNTLDYKYLKKLSDA